jgi:hypothetical protein
MGLFTAPIEPFRFEDRHRHPAHRHCGERRMTAFWCASATVALVWLWYSAIRKARRIYAFDRSVGAVTVYTAQVLVSLFWTALLILTSICFLLVKSPGF